MKKNTKSSIDFYMQIVNSTFQQTKDMSWGHIVKFAIYGGLKLIGLAFLFWILRHI